MPSSMAEVVTTPRMRPSRRPRSISRRRSADGFLQRLVQEGQKPAVTETVFHVARNNGEKMEAVLQWTESTDEIDPLLRQRHPHVGRRHARERLQSRHRQGDPQLHRHARDQDQGPGHHRRRHPRGDRRRAQRLRPRADVPGTDQGEAEQPGIDVGGRGHRPAGARSVAEQQHDGGRPDRRPDRAGRQGPAGVARSGQRRSSARA